MRRLLLVAAVFALSGCQAITTPVSTVKAQQTIDFLQATHTAVLRAENIYIRQPACTLPGSPQPPLCASYAVGLQMKRLDDKATKALADAQTAVNTLGNNPAAIDAAIAAAQLAVNELQTFTDGYSK